MVLHLAAHPGGSLLQDRASRRRVRSASVVRPRSICPSTTMEMLPVSSDTTTAIESFSSVSPMAARCRDPSSLPELRIDRQRQEAGGCRDAVLLDDHRPVVQRRRGLEDCQHQVIRHLRVERNAALDIVPQPDLPLDGDDGADALRGQHARRRPRAPRSIPRLTPPSRSSGRTARGRDARGPAGCPTGTARSRRRRSSRPGCESAS